ncbi:hypothetical protein [Victivallis sp. Marseille-Q1083]|uniref:hypothetical protein n=1 Tax=Victivallis sp. Marseille-Q1083 TaxID=2717288 RepID=UPI001588C6CA|nr:hypothetical protein [Victivallis sp. Marseille-Q1083]
MAKCSFAKVTTRGVYDSRIARGAMADWEYGTELYGRFFYLESEGQRTLVAAFDFLGTFSKDANRWRRAVAERTGIPVDHIWYHELQIHAAPKGPELSGEVIDRLVERCIPVILEMMDRAEEFTCQVAEADFGTEGNFNREQYVAGLGGVTVWSGMDFDGEGRPCTQNDKIMLLRGYHPLLPVFDKPIYFDNPADPKAYLFRFSNRKGETIGTVSRFAGHPDVAVLFELRGVDDQYKFNFDWPGYLCEKLERDLGGTAVYLNGPCGDLTVKKGFAGMDSYEACAAEARRLGESFADRLERRLADRPRPLKNAGRLKAETFHLEMPMRDDFPISHDFSRWAEEVDAAEQRLQDAIAAGAPPSRVKQLIDDRFRASDERWLLQDGLGFDDEILRRRRVPVTVSALQLGEYTFVGVPGESLCDMSIWLRSQFTGVKTIPVDQVNGYYGYVATPRSLTLGGYTYWSSWVRRDATDVLKKQLTPLLEAFIGWAENAGRKNSFFLPAFRIV